METQIEPTKAKQVAISPQQKVRELLTKQTEQIARALPKFLTPDRFVRVALTTINKNPKLLECTQESLMACIMDCAQLGLEPDNVMGRAFLIPYNDNKNHRMVCQLQVGYKGLCDLAFRSGKVKSLMAQIVCQRDEFDFQFGLAHKLDHKPYFGTEDRGPVVAVYAYAIMENGVTAFDVMGVDDVERIKRQSKSSDKGPWVDHWDEMARKTVLKRLSKYLPLSVEFMDAVAIDNKAEEEERVKAAKIVLPVQREALPDAPEHIPMPTKTEEVVKEAVRAGAMVAGGDPSSLSVPASSELTTLDKLSIKISEAGLTFADFVPTLHGNRMCAHRAAEGLENLSDANAEKFLANFTEIVSAVEAEKPPNN